MISYFIITAKKFLHFIDTILKIFCRSPHGKIMDKAMEDNNMKIVMLGLSTIALLLFSLTASAEKIIISGEPVVIEKKAEVYVPSTVVTTTHDYYYFATDNRKIVCYKEVQPALVKLDSGVFRVKLGTDEVNLHCYDYSPEYFVIE